MAPASARKRDRKRKERQEKNRRLRIRRVQEKVRKGIRYWLERAETLPIAECVVSRGWRERGFAHILLARRAAADDLVVGAYYVDLLCLGLRDTAVLGPLDREEYQGTLKSALFNDPVDFEPCDPGAALGIIEGAIAYAARYGFRPNKRWSQSRRVFAGIQAISPDVEWGRDGKPCLVIKPGEDVTGPRRRLERLLGTGGFIVEERTRTD